MLRVLCALELLPFGGLVSQDCCAQGAISGTMPAKRPRAQDRDDQGALMAALLQRLDAIEARVRGEGCQEPQMRPICPPASPSAPGGRGWPPGRPSPWSPNVGGERSTQDLAPRRQRPCPCQPRLHPLQFRRCLRRVRLRWNARHLPCSQRHLLFPQLPPSPAQRRAARSPPRAQRWLSHGWRNHPRRSWPISWPTFRG